MEEDYVEELIRLTVNSSSSPKYLKIFEFNNAYYGSDTQHLAFMSVSLGIFLENTRLIPKISWDSCRVYSYISDNADNYHHHDKETEGLLIDSLVKSIRSQPMKSYMRLSFCQVLRFIQTRCSNQSRDLSFLLSFMSELRVAFRVLCSEDRQTLRPSSKRVNLNRFADEAGSDAFYLLNWASIEAAKYCIRHKFAPKMSANEFLCLLRMEILSPITLGDKISRKFLINFIQNIDKLISDRIQESSDCKHTFRDSCDIESFYKANNSTFRSWLLKNRQNIAKLSLVINEPAECWRNANLKSCLDLTTRFHGSNLPDQDPSLSQTLMSLNAKNWILNLSLLAKSAKELSDSNLLMGIKMLTGPRRVICEYPPIDAMINNLQGYHSRTYLQLKNGQKLEEQQLIEFLDACIELNRLEKHSERIEELESSVMKKLYKIYLESRCEAIELPKTKFEQIEKWMNTWSELNQELGEKTLGLVQPARSYLDLIVPSCLNIIAKSPPEERDPLIERTEWILGKNFIEQSLFSPNVQNKNIKVYTALLELLKGNMATKLKEDLVNVHAHDLRWNHTLYRSLCDMGLQSQLHQQLHPSIDLIQLRAAKYNQRYENFAQAVDIASDLVNNSQSEYIKLASSLMVAECTCKIDDWSTLAELVVSAKKSNLSLSLKSDFMSKVLRCALKSSELVKNVDWNLFDLSHQNTDEADERSPLNRCYDLLDSASLVSNTKTLLLFSNTFNELLPKASPSDKEQLLNDTFGLNLKLLQQLGHSNLVKHKTWALECATRILRQIIDNHKHLSSENLSNFSSETFLSATTSIWIQIRNNLVSVITCENDLSNDWRKALINVIKHIGCIYPNVFIYSMIVNRLDLQSELDCLLEGKLNSIHIQDPSSLLLQNNCVTSDSQEQPSGKLHECQRKLTFWNELFDYVKSSDQFENRWLDIVNETERFLKEIRKISFLCGEYLKQLARKIPKRIFNFLDHFQKFCDKESGLITNKQRLEECEKRLKSICDQALNSIKILLCYGKKVGESHLTKYDKWFCDTFSHLLKELDYRLNLLDKKQPMVLSELKKLALAVTELLSHCRQLLLEYDRNNRHKSYMELISPTLSRLKPSLIPMPDCCNEPMSRNSTNSLVTIYKISQTVNLIVSKTCPKKLKFIGSDGKTRSYLLKAHEDLRLDQLIMDLFGSINTLLMGNKKTRNDKFKLRRFSVTPVSSRSGLIQWIEAPSLFSSYRSWLNGSNGKQVLEELYQSTCKAVCDNNSEPLVWDEVHRTCEPPQDNQAVDVFYQLLWAKTKPTKLPLTQTKPCFNNILKYRNEFDGSIFQSVVEQLVNRMPDELISNQLWYRSLNSQSYYTKTQQFIRSCATISMVGYIIGLGDRHPENILLDHVTGEVIHIDYNICFEFGRTLSIPEQVPFRLTQNMIHAFGFAGLEGGFTMSCRTVLDVLKESKSVLLHLLNPMNLSFMIGESAAKAESSKENQPAPGQSTSKLTIASLKGVASSGNIKTEAIEMDMCSQESVELRPTAATNVDDLLTLGHPLANEHPDQQQPLPLCPVYEGSMMKQPTDNQPPQSFDFQHNIKTPTKIAEKTAASIYGRIKDKLSGNDECIRHYKCSDNLLEVTTDESDEVDSNHSHTEQSIDLIELDVGQTTENQVEALIMEATCIKNKAAMFEGWAPWV